MGDLQIDAATLPTASTGPAAPRPRLQPASQTITVQRLRSLLPGSTQVGDLASRIPDGVALRFLISPASEREALIADGVRVCAGLNSPAEQRCIAGRLATALEIRGVAVVERLVRERRVWRFIRGAKRLEHLAARSEEPVRGRRLAIATMFRARAEAVLADRSSPVAAIRNFPEETQHVSDRLGLGYTVPNENHRVPIPTVDVGRSQYPAVAQRIAGLVTVELHDAQSLKAA
jgi:hypothetical protein